VIVMSDDGTLYERISRSYSSTRREDPRIAAHIFAAVGAADMVLNVGAGTGNYEPTNAIVVAVEPSIEMVRQRRDRSQQAAHDLIAGSRLEIFEGCGHLLPVQQPQRLAAVIAQFMDSTEAGHVTAERWEQLLARGPTR